MISTGEFNLSTIIVVKNDISQVQTDNVEILNFLFESLRFKERNYFHSRLYKQKIWDGNINFFNKNNGKFLTGLLPEICMALKFKEITFEINDLRKAVNFETKEINPNFLNQWLPSKTDPVVLEDYQVELVNQGIKHKRGVIQAPTSAGKAQPIDSLVSTPKGFVKIKNLKINDEISNPTGEKSYITGFFPQGFKHTLKITFSNNNTVECCEDHLWKVNINNQDVVLPANILFKKLAEKENILIENTKPVVFNKYCESSNFEKGQIYWYGYFTAISDSRIKKIKIMNFFVYSSIKERLSFLKGFLDVLGIVSKKQNCIFLKLFSRKLTLQIRKIVHSLGGIVFTKKRNNNNKISFLNKIYLPKEIIPFGKIEKIDSYKELSITEKKRSIKRIEYIGKKECVCISVSHENKLYLTNNYIVTHNTYIMISLLKCLPPNTPTLILQNRKTLALQNYKEIQKWGFSDVGKLFYPHNEEKNIIVATVQSCEKIFDKLPEIKCVMVDEIHEMMSKTAKNVYKRLTNCSIRLSFSATPFKYGETDKVQKYFTKGFFGPVFKIKSSETGVLTTKDLQKRGRLSKSNCHFIKIKEPKLSYELYIDAVQKGIVENDELNSIIADLACVKLNGRTLILVERIQHGDILSSLIPNSLWVKGEDNAETRSEVIKQLNESKKDVVAIATTGIFNTGISTFIHNLINAAGGKADHLVIQKIGRGLRTAKDKKELNYFDFYFENNEYLQKHSKKRVDVISKLGHLLHHYESYDEFKQKSLLDQ